MTLTCEILVEPRTAKDSEFLGDLLNTLHLGFDELNLLRKCTPCVLQIGEYNSDAGEYAWAIRIKHVLGNTDLMHVNLCSIEARQKYLALSSIDEKEDYKGQLKVLAFALRRLRNNEETIPPELDAMVRLTLSYYAEKIQQHYPDWRTQYLDAPSWSESFGPLAKKIWREANKVK